MRASCIAGKIESANPRFKDKCRSSSSHLLCVCVSTRPGVYKKNLINICSRGESSDPPSYFQIEAFKDDDDDAKAAEQKIASACSIRIVPLIYENGAGISYSTRRGGGEKLIFENPYINSI